MTDPQCPPGKQPVLRPGLRVTAAVMIGVGTLSALTIWGRSMGQAPTLSVLDVAVGVVATVLLPFLLRRPTTGTLVMIALAALSPAATPHATAGALHVARWRRMPVTLGVAVAGVAAHAVQGLWRPYGGLSYGWWLLLMSAAYAALVAWGAFIQANHAVIASLRDRAQLAEEDQARRVAAARTLERTHIAREMHDVLAHRLSLLATYAGAVEYRPDSTPEQLSRAAGIVRDSAHQALADLREVIAVLRADADHSASTGTRPQPVLTDLARLIDETREAGTPVSLDDRTMGAEHLPTVTGRTAYRLVQEALTNARRHAAGLPVQITIDGHPGNRLAIEISNPLPARAGIRRGAGGGTGLVGLTERVHIAGGKVDIAAADGEFRVRASLPWPS